jgi:putative tryptophan/tyrosine transport system substrate-binding protein
MAVLSDPAEPAPAFLRETQMAARSLGVQLQVVEVRDPKELESAFSSIRKQGAGGVVELGHAMFYAERKRIAELAVKNRLPTMYAYRESVDAGGLMSYAANFPDLMRRSASYVDKILKGAEPADLPVQQPARFELVINLKTAKALGLTIPPSFLNRADEVIQSAFLIARRARDPA